MRELAATLRRSAETIAAAEAPVWTKAAALEFVGPAADRLRAVAQGWHGDLTASANALCDAADLLVRAAAAVEEEIRRRVRVQAGLGGSDYAA